MHQRRANYITGNIQIEYYVWLITVKLLCIYVGRYVGMYVPVGRYVGMYVPVGRYVGRYVPVGRYVCRYVGMSVPVGRYICTGR